MTTVHESRSPADSTSAAAGSAHEQLGSARGRSPEPRATRQPRPARVPQEGIVAVVNTAAGMLLLVVVWTLLQVFVLSGISHARAQTLLYERFRGELAGLTAPIGPAEVGDPVALVSMPSIGLEEVVVEGTTSRELLEGPGHRRSTVLPGQEGTALVYGRSATYGAPFSRLDELQPGAAVQLVTGLGEQTLTVTAVRRDGDPVVAAAPGTGRVTFVTSTGEGRLGRFTPDTTLYVDAETSDPRGVGERFSGQSTEAELAMGRDSSAFPMLALCLALLLALTLLVVAARQRWSAVLVWVLACPVALAVAWLTTDTVVRLLPNLV